MPVMTDVYFTPSFQIETPPESYVDQIFFDKFLTVLKAYRHSSHLPCRSLRGRLRLLRPILRPARDPVRNASLRAN